MNEADYEVNEEQKSVELKKPIYVYLHKKDLCSQLEVPKEVIMTLLNHLETQDEDNKFI